MGIICIIGVIAAVILISLCGTEKQQIRNDIPEGVFVSQSGGAIITVSGDSAPEYAFPSSQIHTLGHAQMYALFGIVGFIAAGPMLLFPRFMWFLDTLKYRLYHNWDTTPSYFALVMRKVVTYVAFAIGVGSVLYGYFLFL